MLRSDGDEDGDLLALLPGHPSLGEAAGAVGSRIRFCLK